MFAIIPHATGSPVANSTRVVVQGQIYYSHLKTPNSKGFRQGRYSAKLAFPQKDEDTAQIIGDAIELAATERWGNARPVDWKNPLKNGDTDQSGSLNLRGCYFLEAHSKYQPPVVDLKKRPITGTKELKNGSICNVSLNFVAYETPEGCGVCCYLSAVQFLKNAPWASTHDVLDAFETLGDNPDDAIKEFFK